MRLLVPREEILAGVCRSIALRVANMARRVGVEPTVAFADVGVVQALEEILGEDLIVPEEPQLWARWAQPWLRGMEVSHEASAMVCRTQGRCFDGSIETGLQERTPGHQPAPKPNQRPTVEAIPPLT